MTDGIPDRLTQLRARWQADPSSRVFLQLAEEYRHQGRVQEALEVLQAGLKEHPGYLSALVAKGRCLLELGDPEGARSVLERVVQQDATQMVANKLLVRAYLEIGESDKARQRLDLYSLLNDSDPEIAELRGRVAAVSRLPRVSDSPSPEEPAGRSRMDSSVPPAGPANSANHPPAVFDPALFERRAAPRQAAATSMPAVPAASAGVVFDLEPPAPPRQGPVAAPTVLPPQKDAAPSPVPLTPRPPLTPLTTAGPAPAPSLTSPGRPQPERLSAPSQEPFPELGGQSARRQFFSSLLAEGIFSFDLPAEAPAPDQLSGPAAGRMEGERQDPPTSVPPLPPAQVDAAALERLSSLPKPAREDSSATLLVFPPEPPRAAASPAPPQAVPPPPPPPAMDEAASVTPTPREGAEEAVATVTLGALYLRQGHHLEAERIFREVLRREPGNAAARDALDTLDPADPADHRAGREPQDLKVGTPGLVTRLLAGFEARPEAHGQSKRIFLLNSYLDQLRRAGQRHVS